MDKIDANESDVDRVRTPKSALKTLVKWPTLGKEQPSLAHRFHVQLFDINH